LQGLIVGAAERVLIAAELGEGVAAATLKEGRAEDEGIAVVQLFGGGGVHGLVLLLLEVPAADALGAADEDAGFDAQEAAKAPLGGGHLANQEFLEGAGGSELGFEGGEEIAEVGCVLFGEDGFAGEQAVEGGVLGGAGLAVFGGGPGAEAGVALVGCDLALGWHIGPPWSRVGGGRGVGPWLKGGRL
jgi:hypothetical protein